MNKLSSMHVVKRLQKLVDDVLLMDLLEDTRADNGMQIGFCSGGGSMSANTGVHF